MNLKETMPREYQFQLKGVLHECQITYPVTVFCSPSQIYCTVREKESHKFTQESGVKGEGERK